MEMTFPHYTVHRDPVKGRHDHRALLAAVIARQANSRTVHVVRRAELGAPVLRNDGDNRIHYFAGHALAKRAVRGAFWRNSGEKPNVESDVYQAGSNYVKDHGLKDQAIGQQLTLAGQGTMRTL